MNVLVGTHVLSRGDNFFGIFMNLSSDSAWLMFSSFHDPAGHSARAAIPTPTQHIQSVSDDAPLRNALEINLRGINVN